MYLYVNEIINLTQNNLQIAYIIYVLSLVYDLLYVTQPILIISKISHSEIKCLMYTWTSLKN